METTTLKLILLKGLSQVEIKKLTLQLSTLTCLNHKESTCPTTTRILKFKTDKFISKTISKLIADHFKRDKEEVKITKMSLLF